MKILPTAVFSGPSVFAPFPVIYLKLDLAGLEAWPSGRLGPEFAQRLLELLPGLDGHASGGGRAGGFAARLVGRGEDGESEEGGGLPFALLLGHVAVELERLHSALERPRSVLLRGKGRQQEVFLGYESAEIALQACRLAPGLLAALLPAEAKAALAEPPEVEVDPAAALRDFEARVAGWAFDPTSKLLLRAAARRGIPWQRVTPRGRMLALGQGCHLRRLQGCLTDRTPATSAVLLADGKRTGEVLSSLGLPTQPRGRKPEPGSAALRRYSLLLFGGRFVSALQLGGEGGEHRAVTTKVHPAVRAQAERAARALGLEAAGVAYAATDIALAPAEGKGVLLGIEPAPDLARHARAEPERDLPGRFLERLFPKQGNGRVPLAAVTGTNGKTTTTRMLARILEASGRTTGFASTDGAYVGGELVLEGDVAGRSGARAVLTDPRVEAAVLETARGGLLQTGAGFDFCDVSAVTNVTSDHLGIDGVETLEQLARVKQSVVEVTRGTAVLNADDPLCREIAGRSKARTCLVTLEQDNEAVTAQLRRGGMAVVLGPAEKGGHIVVVEERTATPLMAPAEIPATLGGLARHNVQNAMFAAALARGLGIPLETIRAALAGFENSLEMSPGRLNITDRQPFTVAMDYGHNPEGIEAVSRTLQARYPDRRRLCVLTVVGSRHADHIPATAKAIAGLYDGYICGRDDTYSFKPESLRQRGFPAEEIPQRCADALKEAGVAADKVTAEASYLEAVEAGLRMARPGDLLAIFTDEPQRTWDLVAAYKPTS